MSLDYPNALYLKYNRIQENTKRIIEEFREIVTSGDLDDHMTGESEVRIRTGFCPCDEEIVLPLLNQMLRQRYDFRATVGLTNNHYLIRCRRF